MKEKVRENATTQPCHIRCYYNNNKKMANVGYFVNLIERHCEYFRKSLTEKQMARVALAKSKKAKKSL